MNWVKSNVCSWEQGGGTCISYLSLLLLDLTGTGQLELSLATRDLPIFNVNFKMSVQGGLLLSICS